MSNIHILTAGFKNQYAVTTIKRNMRNVTELKTILFID